jgi:hypothetical protein
VLKVHVVETAVETTEEAQATDQEAIEETTDHVAIENLRAIEEVLAIENQRIN